VTTKAEGFLEEWKNPLLDHADRIMEGKFTYFSYHKMQIGEFPNWFYNPFENCIHSQSKKHWTEINDFGEGDIKCIWELSRFDWLTVLARAYKVTTEQKYFQRINYLLANWSTENSLNQGPNWKCGQETSIRLMKLLTTAHILDQFSDPLKALQDMVYQHLQRIRPNLTYAVVQDNNHGTSESAAMYIGAAWLLKTGYNASDLKSIKNQGRKVFEERVLKLIQSQGTFAQRSMNYHRVMVDTATFVLRNIDLPRHEILDKQILLLRNSSAVVFLKIPESTFRPGNDAFHIDLWVDGEEVLCDSGTYSYNDSSSDYYKSVAAHNTVQFDEYEQMPKISRFLYGSWITPDYISEVEEKDNELSWTGKYTDYKGNEHSRTVRLSEAKLYVQDRVKTSGVAKARYHFANSSKLSNVAGNSSDTTTAAISKYYYQKQAIRVHEIEATTDGIIDFAYALDS